MFDACGIVIVVTIINPYLIIPAIVLTMIVIKLRNFYIRTGRDVKRFEGMS